MSDIEYLSIKEFDGKLKSDEVSGTVAGTLATLTASAGRDLYLARAKVTFTITAVNLTTFDATVELRQDGVAIETASFTYGAGASGDFGVAGMVYEFKNIGHKVLATGNFSIFVVSVSNSTVNSFIEGFEEVTGETPQIPST